MPDGKAVSTFPDIALGAGHSGAGVISFARLPLLLAERVADERIGEDEAGLVDIGKRQHHGLGRGKLRARLDLEPDGVAVEAGKDTLEALAAGERTLELDLRLMARPALEIRTADERPGGAGGGN